MAIRTEPFLKDLPVGLTEDEVRQRTLQHIELLNDVDKLDEQKKAQTKELNETIKEKKKQAKKIARVVVDKFEQRPTYVREVADWETKRVMTVRKSTVPGGEDVVVDVRGMTLDEQQVPIPGTDAPAAPKGEDSGPVVEVQAKKLSDKFRVVLFDAGEKPLEIIKAVKVGCSVNLGQAKSLVASADPSGKVILETYERGHAEAFVRDLEKKGAQVELRPPEVDTEGNPVQKALPAPKEPEVRKGGKKAEVEAEAPPVTPEQIEELGKKFRRNAGVDDAPKGSRAPKERRTR